MILKNNRENRIMDVSEKIKKISERLKTITDSDTHLSKDDPRLKDDFYHSILYFGLAAGLLLCMLSFIGALGTRELSSGGFIFPGVNGTLVYILIFCVNFVFVLLFHLEIRHFRMKTDRRQGAIFSCFAGINMVLASLTFFTTQRGSSFFFEYILVTVITYLVPNSEVLPFVFKTLVNILSMAVVLDVVHHQLAWQDLVDTVLLYIICGLVNWVWWRIFYRSEAIKYSISDQRNRFYEKSRTDELTGLLNRSALREDFTKYLDQRICVALIDLDSFKKYNDTYGHAYGDRVLKQDSASLMAIFHDGEDQCYRYGGDELLVLSLCHDSTLFYRKLSEFQSACEEGQDGIKASVSIGYYCGTAHSEKELRILLKIADSYLYRAKGEGKGRIAGNLSPAEKEAVQLMAEQMSVQDTLRSLDGAAELFDHNGLPAKDWSIAYLNINQYAELIDEVGYQDGRNVLEKISRIILNYFPGASLINREVDHFVLYSTVPEKEFEHRIRNIQSEASRVETKRRLILRAGIFHHHASDAPMEFLAGMYNAKYASDAADDVTRGSQYFCIYDAEMNQERTKESYVHHHFLSALKQGCFVPFYQPIVGSMSGTTCGFEALSRWIDPEKGLIPPGDYIPYLEKMNEVYRLDLCLLEQVCRDLEANKDHFPEKLFVNVNLSQVDFQLVNIPEEVDKIVSRYKISKKQIQFEITESAFADQGLLQDAVRNLRTLGYGVWMDDFGVGESSLSSFRNYDVQGVKLDQSFFADFSNQKTRIIIRSIVDLSHETNSMMIAEGIETWEQLWYARQWGVNYIQGFYFSKPLPLKELLASSFIRNLTDDSTDQFYQAAAEVNLTDVYSRHYISKMGEAIRIFGAVLEWTPDGRTLFLRMNDEMQQLVRDSVVIEGTDCVLKKNSILTDVIRNAVERIRSGEKVYDFQAELNRQKLHGQLSCLSEDTEHGRLSFVLYLVNFVLKMA